jgi:uncharacterized membrane protein HdeD (DUF308 family)
MECVIDERQSAMSSQSSTVKSVGNGIRTWLAIGGLVALIVGVLILAWPLKVAAAVAVIVGAYAIVGGIVYLCLGIFSRAWSGWSRFGHVVLGILYIVAGVVVFSDLRMSALWLATFLGLMIGITWIIESVVTLTTLGRAASKGWSVFYAIVSLIAGVVLLFTPLLGAILLWWMMGISLVVLGILQIIRALTLRTRV